MSNSPCEDRNSRGYVAFTVATLAATILPLLGGIVLYSDATGQKPLHTEAVVGLLLLWLGWTFVVAVVTALALDVRSRRLT